MFELCYFDFSKGIVDFYFYLFLVLFSFILPILISKPFKESTIFLE